jgi:hypothetical protein
VIDVFWKVSARELDEFFRRMSDRDAEAFFDQYLRLGNERLTLLNQIFYETGGGNEDDLDFSPDSLIPLWQWAMQRLHPREFSALELTHIMTLPEWFRQDQLKSKPLSEASLILINDIAYYLAEVLIRNLKGIHWGICKAQARGQIDENQPVLLGFKITVNPRESVKVAAIKTVQGDLRKEGLLQVYEKCCNLVPPTQQMV